ncbi:MAG: hypothetical protein LBV66_03475, partial [Elusimicrobiota bacterium]|nr:hypothetical protein [Elusimicrobiota bacterium]
MFLIAPSCDILKKALIANVLAAICNENKMQSIILDLSIAATEAFWSVYKDGVKYVEDIIPVLSGISSKTLKKYLSPMEESLVLGLKESSFDDMNFEKISYLIDVLEENYKYVFVIVPNENKDNTFNLVKKAKICLLPYLSDSLSARNALILADLYLSKCGSEAEIIPLRLDLGYDFHSEQILKKHSVFAKQFTAIFNPKVQEKVMYPENVYKDNS